MNDLRGRFQSVSAKEDRGAEDPFEGRDQPPILFSAFTHSKRLQHRGRGLEFDGPALLLNRQCREKDRNEAVLAKRYAVIGMTGDLKDEAAILAFVKQLVFSGVIGPEPANRAEET
jgi:hypothetical protein